MKKLIMMLALVGATATAAMSQTAVNEDQLLMNALKLEKRALVTQFMALPDDQAALFWPIYDKYEIERTKLANRRYTQIQHYVSQYLTLEPENTKELVKESIAINKEDLSLRSKYYKQVLKNVNPNVAARFYQIEDAIQTAVKAELYSSLPAWEGK